MKILNTFESQPNNLVYIEVNSKPFYQNGNFAMYVAIKNISYYVCYNHILITTLTSKNISLIDELANNVPSEFNLTRFNLAKENLNIGLKLDIDNYVTNKEKIKSLVLEMLETSHKAMINKLDNVFKHNTVINIDNWNVSNEPMIIPKNIVVALLESEANQYTVPNSYPNARKIKQQTELIKYSLIG
jgi:hypothetical protein